MPKLLHSESSPLPCYNCGAPVHQRLWDRGEVRDVSDEAAEYLLRKFAGIFVEADAVVAEAVAAPAVDRAIKAPAKRKKAPAKKAPAKKATKKASK
jgi:hypothetical protein|tara:strand:+ start:292 stop:579 length:288 start_codon:yes stop_codon:yes gene_type:complete